LERSFSPVENTFLHKAPSNFFAIDIQKLANNLAHDRASVDLGITNNETLPRDVRRGRHDNEQR